MKTKKVRYIVTRKVRAKWIDTWWTGNGEEETPPLVTKRLAESALKIASEAYPRTKFRIEERLA